MSVPQAVRSIPAIKPNIGSKNNSLNDSRLPVSNIRNADERLSANFIGRVDNQMAVSNVSFWRDMLKYPKLEMDVNSRVDNTSQPSDDYVSKGKGQLLSLTSSNGIKVRDDLTPAAPTTMSSKVDKAKMSITAIHDNPPETVILHNELRIDQQNKNNLLQYDQTTLTMQIIRDVINETKSRIISTEEIDENDMKIWSNEIGLPADTCVENVLPRYRACAICTDKSTGYHYGVSSCEGCKGFFRRCVQKNVQMHCDNFGSCVINKITRNNCQSCRLTKCYEEGMSKEAVRFDRNKLSRSRVDNQVDEDEEMTLNVSAELPTNNNNNNNNNITKIVLSYQCIFSNDEYNQETENQQDITQTILWEKVAELSTKGVKKIVDFSKILPGFSDLCTSDQIILLKGACLEILFLRLCSRYHIEFDCFMVGGTAVGAVKAGDDFSNGHDTLLSSISTAISSSSSTTTTTSETPSYLSTSIPAPSSLNSLPADDHVPAPTLVPAIQRDANIDDLTSCLQPALVELASDCINDFIVGPGSGGGGGGGGGGGDGGGCNGVSGGIGSVKIIRNGDKDVTDCSTSSRKPDNNLKDTDGNLRNENFQERNSQERNVQERNVRGGNLREGNYEDDLMREIYDLRRELTDEIDPHHRAPAARDHHHHLPVHGCYTSVNRGSGTSPGSQFSLKRSDFSAEAGLESIGEELFDLASDLSRMQVDATEYALLVSIMLLSGDRFGLEDSLTVERLQEPLLEYLNYYCRKRRGCHADPRLPQQQHHHGNSNNNGQTRPWINAFPRLIQKLTVLRGLSVRGAEKVLNMNNNMPPLIVEMLDREENVCLP